MITLGEVLKICTESLVEVSDSPNLDCQTLLADRLGQSRAWILAHPDINLTQRDYKSFQDDIEQLKMGVPLPYVLGHWEFYGLDFSLTRDTLIPRPETELLVEFAVDWLDRHPEKRWAADIGTGSGCIAITLAKNMPNLSMVATDISFPALKVAWKNSSRHNVANQVKFVQSDLLLPVNYRFDLICANLPYIPTKVLPTLKVSKGEPELALNGGPQGVDFIARFLESAPDKIAAGGTMLIEIERIQGQEVKRLAQRVFTGAEIIVNKDLSGFDRLVAIHLPEDASL